MEKKFSLLLALVIPIMILVSCTQKNGPTEPSLSSENFQTKESVSEKDVVDLTGGQFSTTSQSSKKRISSFGWQVKLVKLRGKINHFGYDITQNPPAPIDYHATVPGVKVWIAEYPFTKYLNIRSDESGWWQIYILKIKNKDLKFSFIYEKAGWVTTKSNIITVNDEDNLDLAIHFIDPNYYYYAVKPGLEQQLSDVLGSTITINNGMIVTVAKSWASLHDDRLPHGDPGAIATINPLVPAIGPLYFNEHVQPDPLYTSTSVDGGVAWINVPIGVYDISANKENVAYDTVKFNIDQADTTNGVVLYIASPPDSVQGTNHSGPGED